MALDSGADFLCISIKLKVAQAIKIKSWSSFIPA